MAEGSRRGRRGEDPPESLAIGLGLTGLGVPKISVGLTQEILAYLQRPRRAAAADDRLRSAAQEVLTAALDVVPDVRERYVGIQSLLARRLLLEERRTILEKLRDVERSRLEHGEAVRANVTALDAERAEVLLDLADRARLIGRPSAQAQWSLDPLEMPGAAEGAERSLDPVLGVDRPGERHYDSVIRGTRARKRSPLPCRECPAGGCDRSPATPRELRAFPARPRFRPGRSHGRWVWTPMRGTNTILCAFLAGGCSTGYRPHPLADRAVLEDLRALRLEALRPAPDSGSRGHNAPFDARDGLSMDEAVAVGLYLNPDLRAFRMERGVAEGELVAAGVLPNPGLEIQWLHIPNFTRSLATGGITLGLSWEPPRPGERAAKVGGAAARVAEVREEIGGEEWRVATEVRKAYATLAGVEEKLRLADLALKGQERVRAHVRSQVEGGVANRLDAGLAEITYATALRDREGFVGDRDRARLALTRLLGLPPLSTLRLQGGAGTLAFRPFALNPTGLEDTMLALRPDLRAARMEYQRSEQDLRLACIQRIPWIHFGPTYERDGSKGEGTIDKFGVGVGVELPIANRNEGEIAKLTASREKLRGEFTAKLHAARGELYEALGTLAAQTRSVRLFTESVEPALAEGERILQAGIDAKEVDLLRYFEIHDKAIEARRAHVESLQEYWTAVFDLERAVGARLVP